MKVYFNRSEKVMEKWPDDYWAELERKLIARGHTVHADPSEADVSVGPPGYEFVGRKVVFLGPTLEGEGIKSPIICAGCLDKIKPTPVDCYFRDEICFLEITPNDVLEALCGS